MLEGSRVCLMHAHVAFVNQSVLRCLQFLSLCAPQHVVISNFLQAVQGEVEHEHVDVI